jgi:hypothetical protein
MGQRVAASLGHPPGSSAEEQIIEAYLRVWRDLHLPHIPGGGTAISKEQFLVSTSTLAADPAAARATVGAIAEAFHGGHFPGLTEADAHEAFAHLDTDGDGLLSAEELIRATIEYWSSTDPDAPGNWWMGRPTYQD